MLPKKYYQICYTLVLAFGLSMIMTLLITAINTGINNGYIGRFLSASKFSFPVAVVAGSIVAPLAKKIVDKTILK